MRKSLSLIAAGALCWCVGSGYAQNVSSAKPSQPSAPETTLPDTPGDPLRGKATWHRVGCFTCHGYAAQGAITTGPQLAGRDFTLPVLDAIVRNPPNLMPPYSKTMVSDAELADIMAYINGLGVGSKK